MPFRVLAHQSVFEPERFFPQCHASTLLQLGPDHFLTAWFAGTHEQHHDVAIWYAHRLQGKWQNPRIAADVCGIPCWNPVLFQPDPSLIYLYFKAGLHIPDWQTMVVCSEDQGRTWSQPRELIPGDIGGRGPVKNKLIILQDGAWLAPASRETSGSWDAFTDRSDDKGKSWQPSPLVPIDHQLLKGKGIIQPTLWESGPGCVHMLLRSTEGCIYRSNSGDGGRSWSEAWPTCLPNNNSGIDLVRIADGLLVLACNPVAGNWAGRSPIALLTSADNGQTWSDPWLLEGTAAGGRADDSEFSYPAVIADGEDLFITYTWNRKTIAFWHLRFC